ncbi:MAG: hypothetical protein LUQ17_00885, partial [Methanomicrobiales archaeon]|nr:hypothetical protein [Methanomicrobiales archaeon]
MRLVCFIAILFLGIVCIAQGATLTVGSAGAQYTSIQDAVDHALPGDLILIGEGRYVTSVEITAPVTIQGAGRGKTILVPGGSGHVITIASEGTRIEYLDILGEGGPGVRITADRVEMKGVGIQGCGIGVTLESASGARITESEITGSSGYGLLLV